MQYGSPDLSREVIYNYMGTNILNDNYTWSQHGGASSTVRSVSQRDADLLHYQHKVHSISFTSLIFHYN